MTSYAWLWCSVNTKQIRSVNYKSHVTSDRQTEAACLWYQAVIALIIKIQHCSTQQVPQSNRGCLSVIPSRYCPYLLSKHSIVRLNRFHSQTKAACLWYQAVIAPIYYQNTALFYTTGSTVKQRLPVCDTKPLLPLFIIKTQHCSTQQVPQSNRGCLSVIPSRYCPYLLSKHSIVRHNRFHSQTEAACLWYQAVIAPIYYQNTALLDTTGSTVKQRLPVCDTKPLLPLFIIKTQHCSTQQVPQSNKGCLSVIPSRYRPYYQNTALLDTTGSTVKQRLPVCDTKPLLPLFIIKTQHCSTQQVPQSNKGCLSVIPSRYCPYLLSKHSIVLHNRFHSQTKAACLWYQAVIAPIYYQNTALFDTTGSTVKQRLPVCDTKPLLPIFIIKTQHCSTQQVPQSNRGCLSVIPSRHCPYLLSKHSIARHNRFHSQTKAACLWYQAVIAPIYYQNTALFNSTGSTVKQRLSVCDTKPLLPLFIIKTQHCSTQQVPQSNRGCLSVIPSRYCPYLLSKHSIVLHNRFHSLTEGTCLWYQAVIAPIYYQNTALFDTTGSTVKQRLPVCDTKTLLPLFIIKTQHYSTQQVPQSNKGCLSVIPRRFLPLFIIKTQHHSTQQVPQSNKGCLSVIPSRYCPYLLPKHSIVRHNRFHSQTKAACLWYQNVFCPYLLSKHSIIWHNRFHSQTKAACLWYQAVIAPIYYQNTALFDSTGSTVKQRLPVCDTKPSLPLFIIRTQHCSTHQVPQSNRGCLSVIPSRYCPYLLSKHSIVRHIRFHSQTEAACLWYQAVIAPIYYQNTALFDSTGSTVKQRLPVCDTKQFFAPIYYQNTALFDTTGSTVKQRLPVCDTKPLLPLFIIKTQHCSTQQVPQSNRGCLSVIPSC